MKSGFNIINKKNYPKKLFKNKISIINFLKNLINENDLPYSIAIYGLEELIYRSENPDKTSKFIRDILQDSANFLMRENYIIQIVIEGDLEVIESSEKPIINYLNAKIPIYPIFGRVKQIDIKKFYAPLNLQS